MAFTCIGEKEMIQSWNKQTDVTQFFGMGWAHSFCGDLLELTFVTSCTDCSRKKMHDLQSNVKFYYQNGIIF